MWQYLPIRFSAALATGRSLRRNADVVVRSFTRDLVPIRILNSRPIPVLSRCQSMAGIKQNGILGQLLRDSWLAFTEGLL